MPPNHIPCSINCLLWVALIRNTKTQQSDTQPCETRGTGKTWQEKRQERLAKDSAPLKDVLKGCHSDTKLTPGGSKPQKDLWGSMNMNSMKLVIPLHFISWKKDSEQCCDTTTPESIHTKDESKRETAFAFIFGVDWLWLTAKPRLLSSLVWIDSG